MLLNRIAMLLIISDSEQFAVLFRDVKREAFRLSFDSIFRELFFVCFRLSFSNKKNIKVVKSLMRRGIRMKWRKKTNWAPLTKNFIFFLRRNATSTVENSLYDFRVPFHLFTNSINWHLDWMQTIAPIGKKKLSSHRNCQKYVDLDGNKIFQRWKSESNFHECSVRSLGMAKSRRARKDKYSFIISC